MGRRMRLCRGWRGGASIFWSLDGKMTLWSFCENYVLAISLFVAGIVFGFVLFCKRVYGDSLDSVCDSDLGYFGCDGLYLKDTGFDS